MELRKVTSCVGNTMYIISHRKKVLVLANGPFHSQPFFHVNGVNCKTCKFHKFHFLWELHVVSCSRLLVYHKHVIGTGR